MSTLLLDRRYEGGLMLRTVGRIIPFLLWAAGTIGLVPGAVGVPYSLPAEELITPAAVLAAVGGLLAWILRAQGRFGSTGARLASMEGSLSGIETRLSNIERLLMDRG